jgi:hypothetical protein
MNNVQYSDPVPNMQPPPKQGGMFGLPTWAVILLALVGCICLVCVCGFVVLALSGDAIGNVFSNIISTLEATPSP